MFTNDGILVKDGRHIMSTEGNTLAKVRLEDGTVVYNQERFVFYQALIICGGRVGDLRYKTCGVRSRDFFPTSLDIIIVITGFSWSRRVHLTLLKQVNLCCVSNNISQK